jgi:hypothetical protein
VETLVHRSESSAAQLQPTSPNVVLYAIGDVLSSPRGGYRTDEDVEGLAREYRVEVGQRG